jgi:hypothetical protein
VPENTSIRRHHGRKERALIIHHGQRREREYNFRGNSEKVFCTGFDSTERIQTGQLRPEACQRPPRNFSRTPAYTHTNTETRCSNTSLHLQRFHAHTAIPTFWVPCTHGKFQVELAQRVSRLNYRN